jgi:hypothetical protein
VDLLQMELAIAYANIPLSELRCRRIPEQLIQFIEANRSTLLHQRTEALAFSTQTLWGDPCRAASCCLVGHRGMC